MVTGPFQLARIPPVRFGPGRLAELPGIAAAFGRRVLLVTGAASLRESGRWEPIGESLLRAGMEYRSVVIEGEPSTRFIDETCAALRGEAIEVVVGIGGGSVIDGAKALSAMLPHGNSVRDHLEDVGTGAPHSGVKVPYVAIPTTSGTGGEMTKNAVISSVGPDGYKKSLRHDNLIPDAVIVDPELMLSCPAAVTAACGMDAFTQLLEPYLSPLANPITDALALSGLERIGENLLSACGEGAGDVAVRGGMAYASMLSGIVLANAGLGIVHGLASPIGGYFPVPHGVVCGTLVASATAANIKSLRKALHAGGEGASSAAMSLGKYARVGLIFGGRPDRGADYNADVLIEKLREWTEALRLPKLGAFGIGLGDLDRIADNAGNRQNPVILSREEIRDLVASRL